jgi:hypothetical protein
MLAGSSTRCVKRSGDQEKVQTFMRNAVNELSSSEAKSYVLVLSIDTVSKRGSSA